MNENIVDFTEEGNKLVDLFKEFEVLIRKNVTWLVLKKIMFL